MHTIGVDTQWCPLTPSGWQPVGIYSLGAKTAGGALLSGVSEGTPWLPTFI